MSKPKNLLIIDPDSSSRRLLIAALSDDERYILTDAANGQEGLELFKENPKIELVIVDPIDLRSTGLTILEQLRVIHPTTPILVLSTYQTTPNMAKAMEIGADDFLFKPVDLGELRATIALLTKDQGLRKGRKTAPRSSSETNKMVMRNEAEGTFVEICAPTDSPHIERFERFIRRLLEHVLDKDEFFSMRLALEESITNAIEWGNRNDRSKQIKLSYCLLSDRVTFRVEDQGEGFDPGEIPDPTKDPKEHIKNRKASGKRMGGWGLFLTQKAVDDMQYNKKGNVVILTKYFNTSKEKKDSAKKSTGAKPSSESEPTS